RAIGPAALRAMGAGYGQVQGGEKAVDVGDFAAGDHGESVIEVAAGAVDLFGEVVGNMHRIGRFGDVHQRSIEVDKQRKRWDLGAGSKELLGHVVHGGFLSWHYGVMRGNAREPK